MIIKAYAYCHGVAMYEAGKKAGLSDKAADYFRHFEEVTLDLDVSDTGEVIGATLDMEYLNCKERQVTHGKEES